MPMIDQAASDDGEQVVLVHGLYFRAYAVWPLSRRLAHRGFACAAYSYPSFAHGVAENAAGLARFLERVDALRVHFVCHSLGGLVVRRLLADRSWTRPGRVVTLGTPHRYSYVARAFASRRLLRWLLGASWQHGLDGDLPPWPAGRQIASIAGTVGVGLGLLVPGLPRPNDGTVSVEETRLDGAGMHLDLPVTHTSILLSARVADEIATFLRTGRFMGNAGQ